MPSTMGNVSRENQQPARSHVKLLIAAAILTAAVGYLVFSSVKSSSAYYMTIGELEKGGAALENRKVRVSGTLMGDTVQWNARELQLDFEITDESGKLFVTYHGARPDMFNDGAETVIEGKYVDGTFQATNLLLKCPSKYEDAEPTLTAASSN